MHFDKPTYKVRKNAKKEIPKVFTPRNPLTGEILFNKEIEDNQMVVPRSGHHFPIGAAPASRSFLTKVRLWKAMPA